MKKLISIIALMALVSLASAQTQLEQKILELSKKKFQWMVSMNYDSLGKVLDDSMIFIHSNGWAETKSEFFQDIKSAKLRYNSITVTEASARVYPAAAVVIGRGKFNVKLDGKDYEFDLKYSEFYILQDGKWHLASRHANKMQ